MPNTDERDLNFSGEDTSLDDLYNDDFSDMDENDSEDEDDDDEEKTSSQFESNPNKQKNKIIIGIGLGILALFAGVGLFQNSQNKKKAAELAAKEQQQTDKSTIDGTEQSQEGQKNNFLGQQGTAQGTLDAGAGIPCNPNNPNDPNNVNNPNCAATGVNGQTVANTNDPTQQIPQNANGQPQQIPQDNNNYSSYNGGSGNSNSGSYNSNSGSGGGYASAPVRHPKSLKQVPQAPEAFQPKTITKPTSTLGSVSNGKQQNTASSQNPAAVTTNGEQGQTQAQADAINNTQQRVRPTNDVKKADNVNTFLLSPGTYIPLAVTTQMNSDKESYFMGIVRENVYSQNGQHRLLIPMGSKVIGNYKELSSNTATRMFMFVEKIIFPNQQVAAFSNVNVVDLQGEIGTRGKLNSRFWQRLGNTTLALTFSAADLAFNYRKAKAAQKAVESKNGANISTSTWEQVLTSPVQSVKDVTKALNEAWMAPKNRIKVPIGTRLNVMIMDDLVLPEYKGR